MPKRRWRDHKLDKKSCQVRQAKKLAAKGHTPNPTEIRVLGVGKSLQIEPFQIPEIPLKVGRPWRKQIEDFEDETLYFEITDIRDRVNTMKK